ncbi:MULTISPECIES: YugN family protein [Paenibacillus]|uniref:YugN-like family protein n=1 Tax=Paenibacillus vini TaxID=1476024 RepID=A0ABQ4M742_9BACL|nr:YugN family protein [Paenibacillus vini]MDN4068294.1 YugN family protein [Paenibacillus vini]GIP51250.1 hypothetical protein J42TS3_02850 [Paenibacillus vini]
MLSIPSSIEGKRAFYGDFCRNVEREGFHICGSWEYYSAFFDSILYQNEGITIYLRLPTRVIEGRLDRDNALLEFDRPFLIKHIVHTGIDTETDFGALAAVGLNQFQKPIDPDDRIEQEAKWRQIGEQAINRISGYVHEKI